MSIIWVHGGHFKIHIYLFDSVVFLGVQTKPLYSYPWKKLDGEVFICCPIIVNEKLYWIFSCWVWYGAGLCKSDVTMRGEGGLTSKKKNKSHNEDNITTCSIPPTCNHSLWRTSLLARRVLVWGPYYLLSKKMWMVRVEHRHPKILPMQLPLILRHINVAYLLVIM